MERNQYSCFNSNYVDIPRLLEVNNESSSHKEGVQNSKDLGKNSYIDNELISKNSKNIIEAHLIEQKNVTIENAEQNHTLEEILNKTSKLKVHDNTNIKHLIRGTNWPIDHSVRRHMWKSIVHFNQKHYKQNSRQKSPGIGILKSNKNIKNNNKNPGDLMVLGCTQEEYNKSLDQIFGKSREIENELPKFAYTRNSKSIAITYNYYYLNEKGKETVKRILCVYEYNFPHVSFSPGIVSITSLLLHYMQEHEVFSILCILSSSKEHLIETKANWETSCLVFKKLMKTYSKSSYDTIVKYASEPIEKIVNDWYFWIFDSLSFNHLVKIMDCFLYEGQKVLYRICLTIAHQFSKSLKVEKIIVDKESIAIFARKNSAFQSVEILLKESFNIRNLSRSNINTLYIREEEKRKENVLHESNKSKLESANGAPENSHSLTKLNNSNSCINNTPKIFLSEASTSILSHSNLSTIWNWIPQRFTVYDPKILFTTQEHGRSITTIFNILDEQEHCLIVIKTFQGETFGAFCSCNWIERKQKTTYFGNGETFLFSLAPHKNVFKWVGTKKDKTLAHQDMFIRVNSEKISIGGGSNDGLCIYSNVTKGSTKYCDTFANSPLSERNDFEIAALEIIGFEA